MAPCGLAGDYCLNVCSKECTIVQAFRLCTGGTANRGSRSIALLFLDHGTRRGWGVSVTPRPIFTPGKDPVPFVLEVGWVPGPVWTVAENLAPTGIRSPDRPARSQSLYRLSYPAPNVCSRLLKSFERIYCLLLQSINPSLQVNLRERVLQDGHSVFFKGIYFTYSI